MQPTQIAVVEELADPASLMVARLGDLARASEDAATLTARGTAGGLETTPLPRR